MKNILVSFLIALLVIFGIAVICGSIVGIDMWMAHHRKIMAIVATIIIISTTTWVVHIVRNDRLEY